jgi:4'-phosphopantetheinyl transferase
VIAIAAHADPIDRSQVDLWRLALDAESSWVAELESVLSVDERARAARFRFERDRRRFVAARGLLRHILGRYLGIAARALHFRYGDFGKPELGDDRGAPGLRFNLSHSGGLALLAVGRGRRLGIDVEDTGRAVDATRIAARYFAPGEALALGELPPEQRQQGFYRAWTRKEAYVKAIGRGLGTGLDRFAVSLGRCAELLSHEEDVSAPSRWVLIDVSLGARYAAALAVEGHGWSLRERSATYGTETSWAEASWD